MFSLFPSAYQRPRPSYYPDDGYSDLDHDYLRALTEQRARERREAEYRAHLENARRRKAYKEQLAREEGARRRNSLFWGGLEDDSEPYASFLRPPARPSTHQARRGSDERPSREYSQMREEVLEDLMQQQMAARKAQDSHTGASNNTAEQSPSDAISNAEPEFENETDVPSELASSARDNRDEAARKIQVFIRSHLPRLRALHTIADISRHFEDVKAAFQFPSALDFSIAPSDLDTDSQRVPTLLYTPKNAPLHGHEHTLVKLLSDLDAVESHGDDRIRRARKELVRRIESELSALDTKKTAIWEEMVRKVSERMPDAPILSPKAVDIGSVSEEPASAVPLPSEPVESSPMDLDVPLRSSGPNYQDSEEPGVEEESSVGSERESVGQH